MFRKVAPWYAKRFGPANEFNRRVVSLRHRQEFYTLLEQYRLWRRQFLDESGALKPSYRPAPLLPSFMSENSHVRQAIPVPKGPVETW